MTERLVTERELRDLLRELRNLKQRVAAIEVVEKLAYTPPTAYTPTYEGGTTAGVTTYSVQVGTWARIGKMVIAWGGVTWTAATGTGNAQVSLPFASAAAAANVFSGSIRNQNVTFANGSVQAQISAGASFFFMNSPATNAAGTNVAVEAAGTIIFAMVYAVD